LTHPLSTQDKPSLTPQNTNTPIKPESIKDLKNKLINTIK